MLTDNQIERIMNRSNKLLKEWKKKYKGKFAYLPKEEKEQAIKEAEIITAMQEKVLEDLLEQIKEQDPARYEEIKLMIDSVDNDPVKVIN